MRFDYFVHHGTGFLIRYLGPKGLIFETTKRLSGRTLPEEVFGIAKKCLYG